jgi:hypothetical protein
MLLVPSQTWISPYWWKPPYVVFLICYLQIFIGCPHPSTNTIKHAFTVNFDGTNTPSSSSDQLFLGILLHQHGILPSLPLPDCSIDTSEEPAFDSPIFTLLYMSFPCIKKLIFFEFPKFYVHIFCMGVGELAPTHHNFLISLQSLLHWKR